MEPESLFSKRNCLSKACEGNQSQKLIGTAKKPNDAHSQRTDLSERLKEQKTK